MLTPSTTMSPFWKGFQPLTVLISVLLPEPEGPHTTTTSPFWMLVVQSVSTWKLPYHLLTFWMSITAKASRVADDLDLLLQPAPARQREADDEVDDRRDEGRSRPGG